MILPISIQRQNGRKIIAQQPNLKALSAGLRDYDLKTSDFLSAAIDGLSQPQKNLPSKFFYDEVGSALFDDICQLDEYYPTRTEQFILNTYKHEISDLAGTNCHLVELGSGSSVKVRTLMRVLNAPLGYVPIDISREHLIASAETFSSYFPAVPVTPVCADYTSNFELPPISTGRYVGFYPGSTIGNFTPYEATTFLDRIRNKLPHGGLLIGVDLIKENHILNAAYDDALGVTAAFNKNILARCNRELSAEFDLRAFDHTAYFNEKLSRMEMHLVSNRDQLVRMHDRVFSFVRGETIHTENSYKYTLDGFQTLARSAGYTPLNVWTDPHHLFSVHYLSARAA
jgi:L-histidine N-alpha-methyltransferase